MNILDLPRYTATDAGRLIGLRPERVRRWLHGYKYNYLKSEDFIPVVVTKDPVIERDESKEAIHASFLDLIELLFVKQFVKRGFSLQKIRKALEEAKELAAEHHIAHKYFFTDGSEIYLKMKELEDTALIQLLSGGQWVIADIIKQLAKQIEFQTETGFAERYYPLGRNGRIVIDPNICFGSPTLIGHGIRTENVFDLFIAEEQKVDKLSKWLNLDSNNIEAAVSFERSLTLAA